jgi:hypothetical protein
MAGPFAFDTTSTPVRSSAGSPAAVRRPRFGVGGRVTTAAVKRE